MRSTGIHLLFMCFYFLLGPFFLLLICKLTRKGKAFIRERPIEKGICQLKMVKTSKAAVLLTFTMLTTLLHLSHALRGALARVGRSANGDGGAFFGTLLGEAPNYRMLLKPQFRQLDRLQLLLTSAAGQTKLHRFGRSLYGVDGSSAIMRSQRGLLQTPEEQRSVIVIDADDGQLMRYGKR